MADIVNVVERRMVELEAENERLRAVLKQIYPTIAGRAIRLQEMREHLAAKEWCDIAQVLSEALSGTEKA